MGPILLEKDKIFRIGLGPSIKEGNWYVGVDCTECHMPILVFDDPTDGKNAVRFIGEGKLSIPCQLCESDTLYSGADVRQYRATFSRKSFREDRPEPSGCPRQPLLSKYRDANMRRASHSLRARASREESCKIEFLDSQQ